MQGFWRLLAESASPQSGKECEWNVMAESGLHWKHRLGGILILMRASGGDDKKRLHRGRTALAASEDYCMRICKLLWISRVYKEPLSVSSALRSLVARNGEPRHQPPLFDILLRVATRVVDTSLSSIFTDRCTAFRSFDRLSLALFGSRASPQAHRLSVLSAAYRLSSQPLCTATRFLCIKSSL